MVKLGKRKEKVRDMRKQHKESNYLWEADIYYGFHYVYLYCLVLIILHQS